MLLTVVASPYLYTDRASDFVQEASTLQAPATKQDADDASIPVSHIDGQCRSVSVLGSAVHGGGTLDQDTRSRPRRVQTNVHYVASKTSLLWTGRWLFVRKSVQLAGCVICACGVFASRRVLA